MKPKISLYDEACLNPDILNSEVNSEIVQTWTTSIKSDIPNGEQNYEVFILNEKWNLTSISRNFKMI